MITDLPMPDLTGDVMAQKAKAMVPGLRVFLLTGHAHALGSDDLPPWIDRLFPKPLKLKDLAAALLDWGL